MKTIKLTRQSLSGIEYQIEYIPARTGDTSEYKVRRGRVGTYTTPIQTKNVKQILFNCGFGIDQKVRFWNDVYFESLFGRGMITLNKPVVRRINNQLSLSWRARHIYSRLKHVSEEQWELPASAVKDNDIRQFLLHIIQNL